MSGECDEALDRLHEYLDGELSPEQLTVLARHFDECWPCGERATFEQRLRIVVRYRCEETAPSELVERVRARVREITIRSE